MKLSVCCDDHEVGDEKALTRGLVAIADGLGLDRLDLAKALAGSTIRVQQGVKGGGFSDAAMDDVLSGLVASHTKILDALKVEIVTKLEKRGLSEHS